MDMNIHVSNTSECISYNSVQGEFVLESQLQARFPSINDILRYLNSSRRFQNPSGCAGTVFMFLITSVAILDILVSLESLLESCKESRFCLTRSKAYKKKKYSSFQLCVVKPDQSNYSGQSQRTKKQSKLEAVTRGWHEERENLRERGTTGFGSNSYWFKKRRDNFKPITERSNSRPKHAKNANCS